MKSILLASLILFELVIYICILFGSYGSGRLGMVGHYIASN
jgi:hypothetical protein